PSSPRNRLSRERVIQAAVRLANAGGLDALTMRELAKHVGAEAMSLYRHVRNKEDLIDGMIDLAYGEIERPPEGAAWKSAVRRTAVSARRVLLRHRWAIRLMESRTRPGPANLAHHDAVLGMLRNAGSSSLDATRIYNLVNSYVYGFVMQEQALPVATPDALA